MGDAHQECYTDELQPEFMPLKRQKGKPVRNHWGFFFFKIWIKLSFSSHTAPVQFMLISSAFENVKAKPRFQSYYQTLEGKPAPIPNTALRFYFKTLQRAPSSGLL